MSLNLKANCYGFATGCRKFCFFPVGCRKPGKVSLNAANIFNVHEFLHGICK